MNRRSFTLAALLAPLAALPALAQTSPAAPATARKKLIERSWAEMNARQQARLLPGFGTPAPTAAEAGPRWDGMDARQRRAVLRAVRQPRS
jgi:hypothetical protein